MIISAALAAALTLGLIAPLAAPAQPAPKVPRIGFLSVGAAARQDAFVQRLRELGHVDKQNITIEYRFGEGRHDYMNTLARFCAIPCATTHLQEDHHVWSGNGQRRDRLLRALRVSPRSRQCGG